MPEGLPAPLHLEIPSDLAFVKPVRKMVEGLLNAYGWVEDDVDDVTLLVTEIVQNAVEHGSRADGLEVIHIELRLEPGAVDIIVTDPGTGRDPQIALARDVEVQPSMDASRGRGLYLIYRLAVLLERRVGDDGGLWIRARKEVSASEAEAS